MNSCDIRKKFFDFFIKSGHTAIESSSLIPAQDTTLLFTNAGMNQFKDIFLGLEQRNYTRAVTIQKCVRAGGKHNDLDNVGFTKRHLTFFEMMGNFSFGDYFKKEAIQFGWDFLTKELALPADLLHVSVHYSDQESYVIWKEQIGIPEKRIHTLGDADNFWQMGDTGPCGPCSEIYIDRGPSFGHGIFGQASASERFLEIWNLVFMQWDKQPDGQNKPLKKTGVDTGMGLERLCAILQNKDSVFQTDLFMPIIESIKTLTGIEYSSQSYQIQSAFHVIADHVRSASLIISDGGTPSNEGRGYVLRKIIRRAALFAQKLTENSILFPEISRIFVSHMYRIYPNLQEQKELIYNILQSEIEKFSHNLIRGKQILHDYIKQHPAHKIISGSHAFKLYDTFGFPLELIHIIADEHGFSVDTESFEQLMALQKEQSGKKIDDPLASIELDQSTEFTGYEELQTSGTIIALIQNNQLVSQVAAGQTCYIITNRSPFFIVGGGQVPDQGWLDIQGHRAAVHEVRYIGNAIAASITAPTTVRLGDPVTSIVDTHRRIDAMKNHTATHLLQAALISHFGKQVKQSGSLVTPDYLRFDFTYHTNLSEQDITIIEQIVNEKIRENIAVSIQYTNLKEALSQGVLAFFGDKYRPEKVRIVKIDNFSAELCGGTHVSATGDIGIFKITEVQSLAAGLRRIVAVTGPKALELFQQQTLLLKKITKEFKVQPDHLIEYIEKQHHNLQNSEQRIKKIKQQFWQCKLPEWLANTEQINTLPVLYLPLSDMSNLDLKEISSLLQKSNPGLYILISHNRDKVLVFISSAKIYESAISLKAMSTWFKQEYAIQTGGTAQQIQGGTLTIPHNFKTELYGWIRTYMST